MNPSVYISDMEFAEDVVVLGDCNQINLNAIKVVLEINTPNKKAISDPPNSSYPLVVSKSPKQLGSIMLPTGREKDDVTTQIKRLLQLRLVLWVRNENSFQMGSQAFRNDVRSAPAYSAKLH